jgi:hypothetical protein
MWLNMASLQFAFPIDVTEIFFSFSSPPWMHFNPMKFFSSLMDCSQSALFFDTEIKLQIKSVLIETTLVTNGNEIRNKKATEYGV